MTVYDFCNLWLHRNNPKAVVRVWSKKEMEYLSSDCKDIEKKEVYCFYSYKEKDLEVLVLNVEE